MPEQRSEQKRWRGVHKALADPLRIRIVEALWETPRSARELAGCLGMPADRLYYHLGQLEQATLIQVVEHRRLARGKVERIYAPAEVEPPGDAADPEEMVSFLGSMLDATRADVTAAYRAKQDGRRRDVDLHRGAVRLTEQARTELRSKIERLVRSYADTCTTTSAATTATAPASPGPETSAKTEEGAVWTRLLVAVVDLQDRPDNPD